MFCPNCKGEVQELHNFCAVCGADLKQSQTIPSTESDQKNHTRFNVKNDLSGEEQIIKVDKVTYYGPILIGSGAECDIILKSEANSEIFEQHALLGHAGHHTYLRTERDPNGKIPASVTEYGHFYGNMTDLRVDGGPFRVGHYTLCIVDVVDFD